MYVYICIFICTYTIIEYTLNTYINNKYNIYIYIYIYIYIIYIWYTYTNY